MSQVGLVGVHKRWGDVVGVEDFNLQTAAREFVVLLGPSGCGKTTTMRMIAGLEDPTAGDISIGGRVVNDLQPKDRDVAMVFQNYGLYPNLTVYENIRFPLKVRKTDAGEHDARVRQAASRVALDGLLERKPRALSGGQRQRVALARAIVRRPAVFLMDEPLSNLDAKLRVSTRAEIKNLQHELQVTTIYVTHDQVEAMTLADRVVLMNQGRVQQIGAPMEIYDAPANAFVAGFIGSPAMNLVAGTVDAGGGDAGGVFTAPNMRLDGLPAGLPGDITVGFRAEDIHVVDGDAANACIRAPVYSLELLGDSTLVTVKSGQALVAARAPKTFTADIGAPVGLAVPVDKCHFFDASHGGRITV